MNKRYSGGWNVETIREALDIHQDNEAFRPTLNRILILIEEMQAEIDELKAENEMIKKGDWIFNVKLPDRAYANYKHDTIGDKIVE